MSIYLFHVFNPLHPGVAFLYPLKISENLKIFRGYRKTALGSNWLNKNDQAKSKVPNNYFKHIHSHCNHVKKRDVIDCLHQVSSHTNFSAKLVIKPEKRRKSCFSSGSTRKCLYMRH